MIHLHGSLQINFFFISLSLTLMGSFQLPLENRFSFSHSRAHFSFLIFQIKQFFFVSVRSVFCRACSCGFHKWNCICSAAFLNLSDIAHCHGAWETKKKNRRSLLQQIENHIIKQPAHSSLWDNKFVFSSNVITYLFTPWICCY